MRRAFGAEVLFTGEGASGRPGRVDTDSVEVPAVAARSVPEDDRSHVPNERVEVALLRKPLENAAAHPRNGLARATAVTWEPGSPLTRTS